ncbi:DNA mismatch repair protein MutL, partial [Halobacterium salinarum]|nr:DNA mismatch repair protein MutL [Halobacterium salinarum]
VPAVLADALDAELARDVLSSFLADADGTPVADAADAVLADLACSPAIKGNTSLAEGSVVALLDALDACENPYACPHGRPTIVEVDGDELAARFERDYPGHAGRRREDAGN